MESSRINVGAERGAIALCSRGLVHSRTLESIEDARFMARSGFHNWRTYLTHDRPIPEAQNEVVERILSLDPAAEWILFVEEDIVLPRFLFQHFNHSPVQAVNYRLPGNQECVRKDRLGNVIFCGLGCTLVHKNVFVSIPRPWFQTSTQFSEEDGKLYPSYQGKVSYGGHDVFFCHALQTQKIQIREVPRLRAEHLRVSKLGAELSNIGYHEIRSL
jgi:hypothetical protein